MTAWIQYSFLDRIAKDEEERCLFLKSIYSQLQEDSKEATEGAESLILQGYLLFAHDAVKELGLKSNDQKACMTKWLLALKRDQTNPDIFYSLGVYYYFRESNSAKALKCLDKALLLKPDFEQAFLLKYTLLCADDQADAGMEAISKIQAANRNLSSTYYLRGVHMLNQGNYIQAIDDLQNATRFYSIQRKDKGDLKSLKPHYPILQEIKEANETMPLFSAKLGLFGAHQK